MEETDFGKGLGLLRILVHSTSALQMGKFKKLKARANYYIAPCLWYSLGLFTNILDFFLDIW